MKRNIVLIGTGNMALDYAKVLKAMSQEFVVIGRGEKSSAKFEGEIGVKPITGGFDNYIRNNALHPDAYVIIATGTEMLMPTLLQVLHGGAEKILVEKPAAISIEELLGHEEELKPFAKNVFVAYNRRFYASTIAAKYMIEEDGGLQSMHFEFTEWAHKIEPLEKAPGVKENWFFANSTHVVDLAFYFSGYPVEWQAYSKSGNLNWHPKVNFAGAGITEKGVLFSYISNWESAGRWAIELLTSKRRIYLKPLEELMVQLKGSVEVVEYKIDNVLDKEFKPGLFLQVENFLVDEKKNLLSLKQHFDCSRFIYHKIIV